MGNILYIKQVISSSDDCGFISFDSFNFFEPSFYFESMNFNSCLHGKISIDENGYVKNCPSLKGTIGHIDKINVREILESEKLRELWHITKDAISVCKNCEFRYICQDCRAFTEEDSILGKPINCDYDPYKK